jgi:hypothetical protein
MGDTKVRLSSGPSTFTRHHGKGRQNPETSALLSQSEISPRGAPQFPVVLKCIASTETRSKSSFYALILTALCSWGLNSNDNVDGDDRSKRHSSKKTSTLHFEIQGDSCVLAHQHD